MALRVNKRYAFLINTNQKVIITSSISSTRSFFLATFNSLSQIFQGLLVFIPWPPSIRDSRVHTKRPNLWTVPYAKYKRSKKALSGPIQVLEMKLITAPCIFLVIFVAIQEIEVTSKLNSYESLLKVRLICISLASHVFTENEFRYCKFFIVF